MCKNAFHPKPCNCDNSMNLCCASEEEKFKANYSGILNKEYAWRDYVSKIKKEEEKRDRNWK